MRPFLLNLLWLPLFVSSASTSTPNKVGDAVAASRPVYFRGGNSNIIRADSQNVRKRHHATRFFELRTTQPPIIIPKNITTKIVNNETVYEHVYTDDVQGKQKFGVRQALRQGAGAMSALLNTVSGGLAAVGGGFLLYATMVGMFGENFYNNLSGLPPLGTPGGPIGGFAGQGPSPQANPTGPLQDLSAQGSSSPVTFALPPGYPSIQKRTGEAETLFNPREMNGMPKLRASEVRMLRQAMEPFFSSLRSLHEIDFPEQMFRVLDVREFDCKQRTICEMEQYIAGKGIAGFILNFLSPRIPGMDKYHAAITTALRHQNCGVVYRSCTETLGQRILRLIGLH